MKNVTVIRMHKFTLARLSDECSRRQPTIQKPGRSPDRAGFSRVSMNDVGPLAPKESKQLPNRDDVVQRYLAAHLLNVKRRPSQIVREVAHVFFTFGHRA